MPQGERRLAAIMFTDMVGYTAMTQSNESMAIETLNKHYRLLKPFFPRFHGREVKAIGDSLLVEFDSALDALTCAVEIQSFLHDANVSSGEEWKIRLRIGIHLGDVVHQAGDTFGDAVNIASRIEPTADPEGVCISEQVYDQVHNKSPHPLVRLPSRGLKNVQSEIEIYKVVMPWEVESGSSSAQYDRKRIAVMPFANMSPDQADEYFADGITEELITSLSGLRGLTVIARTSVMRYKSSPKGASEIGRELNAGTLIEGSVRKAGNRVRITAQLIDTNTEGHVWAKNYDKQLDDIFAIQSEIAEKVTEELRIQLLESEKRKLVIKPTEDTNAYTSYLKARYHWNSRSEEGLADSIRYFEDAVRRDPEYALALVGLADAYSVSSVFGYVRPKTGYLRAKELAQKALGANPDLAEAHASMGEILMQSSYDWTTAAHELDRALQINPNYSIAHVWKSSWYQVHGWMDDAIVEGRRAQELEPFAVVVMNELAKTFYYARRYDDAIGHFVRSIKVVPESAYLHKGLAEAYVKASKSGDALREIEEALALSRSAYILDGASSVYALANEQGKARAVLAELDELTKSEFVPFYGRAAAFAALGDKERALRMLEMAYDEHSWLIWLNVDPIFDSLKSEEGFHSLLQKMNLDSAPGAAPRPVS